MEYGFEKLNKGENLCKHLQFEMAGDPHWENIDCDRMEEADIFILDKLEKGNLTEEEIDQRIKELEKNNKKFDDSSYALSAMLKNKLISKKYFNKYK